MTLIDANRRWIDLELRLSLCDAEEREFPHVRARRDRARPRIYDRHIASPTADPPRDEGVLARELRALDAFYSDTGSLQWSLYGPDGEQMDAWAEAVAPFGMAGECFVVMQRPTRAGTGPEPGVEVLDGPEKFDALEQMQREIATDPAVAMVVPELVELNRVRAARGYDPVILAYRDGDERVAYMMFTVIDGVCWMEDLETRVDKRGSGFARALLATADSEAYRRGAALTGFTADESDWPWHWYQRAGWELTGRGTRLRRLL